MTGFLIGFAVRNWCLAEIAAPKLAATVWPISESDARTPRFTSGRTRAPAASSGTYSRVWSVPGTVGSQPWSAVKMARSPGAQRGLEFRQPGVELFERGAVAFDIVAMAVLLVEIHQVDENQTAFRRLHGLQGFRHAVGIVLGFGGVSDAAAQEDVEDLADAVHGHAAVFQPVEQHALGRRHGVIVAVGGAGESAGRADEGARDHAADLVRAAQNLARGLADPVEFPERDHFFVRRHLEDAVGRGVDDGRTGAHVPGAEFLDDFGAGSRLVPERTAADAALELAHDLRREAAGIERERLREMDAHHFPVAGSRVLAGRSQGAAAVMRPRAIRRRRNSGERLDVAQPQAREVGQAEAAKARNVAEGVAAGGSPKAAASGIAPIPTLSRTIQMMRSNTDLECNMLPRGRTRLKQQRFQSPDIL